MKFHAVNNNFEGEEFDNSYSRKIYADLYIDDRNILGIPDWEKIYKMISEGKSYADDSGSEKKAKKRIQFKSFFLP